MTVSRALSLAPGLLLLALVAPLAACRHGADGLAVGTQGISSKPAPPEPPGRSFEPPPSRPSLLAGRAPAAFHLLPAEPHQHSGVESPTRTYHLFGSRRRSFYADGRDDGSRRAIAARVLRFTSRLEDDEPWPARSGKGASASVW